jgi:hypothetical protein
VPHKDPEQRRQYAKQWRRDNQVQYRATIKDWQTKYPEAERGRSKRPDRINWQKNRDLKRAFGITLDDYHRMFDRQQGLCAICKQPEKWTRNGKLVALSVDHNHKTGKVRELLCYQCNTALGKLREDLGIIESMVEYLRRHNG